MIREKVFYRAFFALTLSLALQNLLTFGVNLVHLHRLRPGGVVQSADAGHRRGGGGRGPGVPVLG